MKTVSFSKIPNVCIYQCEPTKSLQLQIMSVRLEVHPDKNTNDDLVILFVDDCYKRFLTIKLEQSILYPVEK